MSTQTKALVKSETGSEVAAFESSQQFVTFYMGHHLFGLPIDTVIEINRSLGITPAPLAPSYVAGIVNLRGHILTAIHLGKRINLLYEARDNASYHNVIMGNREEPISLLVEKIGDVTTLAKNEIEPPPDLLEGIDVRFVANVCKLPGKLLVILDEKALQSV